MITDTRTSTPGGLQRILGLAFGLAITVGGTIGVGILRTPGLVAGQLGTPFAILGVWTIGGVYTLLGAICLTELGTMAPAAGGYYVYARRAFGETVGFAVGWTDWLTYCAVLAYISIAMGEFTVVLLPSAAGMATPIALGVLIGLVALQWMGVRVSSRFQEGATAIKFAAFLALVLGCLALGGAASRPAGTPPPAGLTPTFAGLIIALQSVVITFGGWQSALYFTEEDRDTPRNLPRAMIGGVAAVIGIYLLVNIALLKVLPVPAIAASALPAADAAQVVLGPRGRQLITALSLISLPPVLNAIMMMGTRILFAMGRDRLLPSRAAAVNAGGTPTVAMLVTFAVAIALVMTGTFQKLVAVVSFFLAANYFVCCLALIVLRRREPDTVRPFRAWGYPVSAAIVVIGAAVFLAGAVLADTSNAAIALLLFAVGLLVRRAMARGYPRSQRTSR
jgi:APA family basic amino acid/polyamine antiporter